MSVGAFGEEGGETGEGERGVIEAVAGGNDESLFRARWNRRGSSADGAIVGHDAENALGLFGGQLWVLARLFGESLLRFGRGLAVCRGDCLVIGEVGGGRRRSLSKEDGGERLGSFR